MGKCCTKSNVSKNLLSLFNLFHSFQQSWKVFMYSVCLSICLFVCARFISRKYSSNVLKFISTIHIWHSMDRRENDIYGTHGSSQRHTKVFDALWPMKIRPHLKRLLTCLYSIKYNKTNACHSNTQKHASYKKWYKCYKYFVYRLSQKFADLNREMFKVYFNVLILH